MATISEPARRIPVLDEVDVCVVGGSCTGVFAAVTAARRGLRVALVEKQNCFGGMATAGLVLTWHSLHDTRHERQIIAGLTGECLERAQRRGTVATRRGPGFEYFHLNTEELKIDLDELVVSHRIIPYLHTLFAAPHVEDDRLDGVIVENKSGRGAIRARCFIDATGDGDLCAAVGIPFALHHVKQPPSTCAWFYGLHTLQYFDLEEAIRTHGAEFNLPEGYAWSAMVPGLPEVHFYAGTRVYEANCADAASLTRAEIEGRRQVRALMDLIRTYGNPDQRVALANLGATIGIRETRHIRARHQLTEADVLSGRRFDDAIANGSYPIDIHHDDKPGTTFRYLDGSEVYSRPGQPRQVGRWRDETPEDPTFYQIPFGALLPAGPFANLLVCGRCIDAERGAYGAVRVMVNTNQTGEAAGAAAYLALHEGIPTHEIDPARLRNVLADGGSLVL